MRHHFIRMFSPCILKQSTERCLFIRLRSSGVIPLFQTIQCDIHGKACLRDTAECGTYWLFFDVHRGGDRCARNLFTVSAAYAGELAVLKTEAQNPVHSPGKSVVSYCVTERG